MPETSRAAFVFPGQGSQAVGMARDLCDRFASAREVFDEADAVLAFPLTRLCFEGPEEELTQTINAQPALLTASFACLRALQESGAVASLPAPAYMAGHSLGEYTALAAAGVFDFATAVRLARDRGRFMHETGRTSPGGMAAVIGLPESALKEVCREAGVWIANINCPGQMAISGENTNLLRAMELAKAAGAARVIPLQVSSAFHTPLMRPVVDAMSAAIASVPFEDPRVPVIANATALPLTTAQSVKEELLTQVCNPVQWQRSVEYMLGDGVDTFIEIGPGRVLSGLIKRTRREAVTLNIGDLPAVLSLTKAQEVS